MRRLAWLACAAGAVLLAAPAEAGFHLRAPQVVFNAANLQGFFNLEDPGIWAPTDQLDLPAWSAAAIGFNSPTLVLYRTNGATIGVYGTGVPNPTLEPIFDAQSAPGAYAVLVLQPTGLQIFRFDANAQYLGVRNCPEIAPDHFQFYMQGPCGTWFGEDARNTPQAPQVLTYAGIERPLSSWWLCFEGCAYTTGGASPSTFASAILDLEYIPPLDAKARSWGAVKALYR